MEGGRKSCETEFYGQWRTRTQRRSRTAAKKPSHRTTPGSVLSLVPRHPARLSCSRVDIGSTPDETISFASSSAEMIPNRSGTASSTDSPSSDSNEHVEYTSRPPRASFEAAAFKIARCRSACRARSSGLRRWRISGLRASVPVPLHGASTRIKSNSPRGGGLLASITAYSIATEEFAPAIRRRIASNLYGLTSEAKISACFSRAASTSVLPPGAAQQSHTRKRLPSTRGAATAASSATRRDPLSICGSPSSQKSKPSLFGSRWPYSQISIATARPYWAAQRSTIQAGCPSRRAIRSTDSTSGMPDVGVVATLRSTAFTIPAAWGCPAARHSSTLWLSAAWAGIRSMWRSWKTPIRSAIATGAGNVCSGRDRNRPT